MNIFDIIGPVMVGPSSSHTAGAAKIGYVARKILKEPVKKAEILLYGSFLATGKGHGTDCAIVAGLLGMKPDDARIPESFEIAKQEGMEVHIGEADELKDAHPNSAVLILTGHSGRKLEVIGESLGGSLVNIKSINGISANFSGDLPTLILYNKDQPGLVSEIASTLARENVNIATMRLYRAYRGGTAAMVIECDQEIPKAVIRKLEVSEGISKVIYYSLREGM